MTDDKEPANCNRSFSMLLKKPNGNLTADSLGATVRLLVEAGISDAEIAEELFLLAKTYSTPRNLDDPTCLPVWHSQLLRFREQLDEHISKIEDVIYEDH